MAALIPVTDRLDRRSRVCMTEVPQLPSDLAALIKDLQASQDAGPGVMLTKLIPQLHRAAKRHLPANSPLRINIDSEDLMQETLLHLIANVGAFRGSSWAEFLAFTKAITLQKAAEAARRAQARNARFDLVKPQKTPSQTPEQPSLDPTPSVHASAKEDKQRLTVILAELPELYRMVMRLRLDGLKTTAIAALLHVTDETVRQRLSRALQMLQERW